ncbi:MAG: glycosyltransferase [Candidatus Omnitrophica bacterium]|nr:glycosyltransferase [Candidatus Omnitrophota bacterium]
MTNVSNATLCDIIILTMDQEELLKNCLISIEQHTTIPIRIIIVNNGGVHIVSYLNGLRDTNSISYTIIHNAENVGFIKGNNQALRLSAAPYVCLLNNDTLVTDGWLTEMIKVCEERNDIGMVNPRSNTLGTYTSDNEDIVVLARKLKNEQRSFTPAGICVGFCMFIKRDIVQKVGYLDETIGEMLFEDADYSMRVKRAGFLCVVAHRSYVYHIEHKSIDTRKKSDVQRIFESSKRNFEMKWGRSLNVLFVDDIFSKSSPMLSKRLYLLTRLIDDDNQVSLLVNSCDDLLRSREDLEGVVGSSLTALKKCIVYHKSFWFYFIAVSTLLGKVKKPFDVVITTSIPFVRLIKLFKRVIHKKIIFIINDNNATLQLEKYYNSFDLVYDMTENRSEKKYISEENIMTLRSYLKDIVVG